MMEAMGRSLKSPKIILGLLGVLVLSLGGMWLIDPDAFPSGSVTEAEQPGPALPAEYGFAPPSEAERIARLQHSLDEQRKYLDKLNKQLNDPDSTYKQAEKRFQEVDADREKTRRQMRELQAAGKNAEAATLEAALKEMGERWQRRRDRFNLAIQDHKTLQESIAAATKQLHEDEQALARLSGASPAPSSSAPASAESHTSAAPTTTEKKTPAASSPSPLFPTPSLPTAISSSKSSPTSSPSGAADPSANRVSREVERAREEAKRKEEAAKEAESKAQSITQRIDSLNENIALTKNRLEIARRRADFEQQAKTHLENELKQKTSVSAPAADLRDLAGRIAASQQRFQQALDEVRSATDHLHDLQTELSHLQAAQIRALHDADALKQAADAAEERIAQLQNPFRPRNIVHWLLYHGPRLLLIALGTFVFHRLSRAFSRRLVQIMAQGTSKRGTRQDRENRSETLVGVFSSALSLLILGGGSLMILDEVGIPIVPLMGGAAVLGLAVAFGAQNLIKDYFSGFMVLLEDQYGINDVVKIGDVSGLVEHISLRTTVLRDLEGTVHFIPHGTITTVSNQTHGWSRALFDVGIDYKEDIDRVMEVLLEIGRDLRRDPAFSPLILDEPEMLGVDQFSDSSVILKFFLKTRPLQQWTVKREMLRRIKKRFDELSIEIPYPHQTVHHRYDSPPPPIPPFSRAA